MSVEEQIRSIVSAHDYVLFMKGNRSAPQCGFSAKVVDILDDFLPEYETVNVLADEAIREGIKAFSNWPTIPQLYVRGEFVGGCDIITEMRGSGELEKVLGASARPFQTPEVFVEESAIAALAGFWDGEGVPCLRLEIDRNYHNGLSFDEPRDNDIVMSDERFTLVMDKQTAKRADGVTIGWIDEDGTQGFKVDNPGAPPSVNNLEPKELKAWIEEGKPFELFDVRTEDEIAKVQLPGARALDADGKAYLDALSKDATIVLYCHHGVRSMAAADHVLRLGFGHVYNLRGGIDAYSLEADPSVTRY